MSNFFAKAAMLLFCASGGASVAIAGEINTPPLQTQDISSFKFNSPYPQVLATSGAVYRTEAGGGLTVIDQNYDLRVDESLITGQDGAALLAFPDGTQILLADFTEIKLKSFFYDEKLPLSDALSAELSKGSVRVSTGKISKRGNVDALQLTHKSTSIRVRGTDFTARVCDSNCPPKSGLNLVKSKASIGRVLDVKGRVNASKSGVFADKVAPRELVLGSPIFKDDVIKTDRNSSIQLVFNDESKVNIEQNSELKVQDLAMGESKKDNTFAANLTKGALRTVTGKIGKANPEGVALTTPTATIGVRGTAFDIACATETDCATNTSVAVREGEVLVTSGANQQAIGPGMAYQFDSKSVPKAINPEGGVFDVFQTPPPETTGNNLVKQLENAEIDTPSGLYVQVNEGFVQVESNGVAEPLVLGSGEGAFSTAGGDKMLKTGVPMQITKNPRLERFEFYPGSCF